MYSKLAFRNIRRSLRDYIIYFVTLTLTAALMYSFLALGFSPDILAMTENMSMLTTGILILSVLIAFMSSFVIGYAIRFMLGQRKKEFAAYELMGMEVKTVRNLFLVENSIIGGVAFLLGTLAGTGLSGLLNQVVQNIFEIPHTYRVLFSFRAWGMTLFFFILMYGFGMFRAAKVIRRQKVIDLLYDNQKNEEIRFQSLHRSVLTGLLSVAAMVAGVILLEKGLHIVDYSLRTVRYPLKNVKIPSFVGNIVVESRLPAPLQEIWQLLVCLAPYTGVGIKTTLGMGSIAENSFSCWKN